eukprot:7837053-Ditylum_brightwellii.AAC.1
MDLLSSISSDYFVVPFDEYSSLLNVYPDKIYYSALPIVSLRCPCITHHMSLGTDAVLSTMYTTANGALPY